MSLLDYPSMLFSEENGWRAVEKTHHSHRWYLTRVAMPMSLLPPVMYAYAQTFHPGAIFAQEVPALTMMQLFVAGVVLYIAQLAMVAYMAMLIQRMATGRDHDPGYDSAYALAAIAPMPLWLGSLAMAVPNLAFNVAVAFLAFVAAAALIRHGMRPILHIRDEQLAHFVANTVTLMGFLAWIGLMIISAMLMSLLFGVGSAL